MLRAITRPLEHCLGSRASGDALLWQSELRPHAGGDYSIAVLLANSRLKDQSQVFTSSSATYVGVYDGCRHLSTSDGCEWYLRVYPKGHGVDRLAVYLGVANPKSLRIGWKRKAIFHLVLLNQSGKELLRTPELVSCLCMQR